MDASWEPVLQDDKAAKAITVATKIARRCCSLKRIDEAIIHAGGGSTAPIYWHAASVSNGYAGIALLSAYMNRYYPGEGWETSTYAHLERAIRAYDHQLQNIGLFTGLAGLAFIAALLAEENAGYGGLQQSLDKYLQIHIPIFLAKRCQLLDRRVSTYDLVSGAVGITTYLISRNPETSIVDLTESCRDILTYLVSLTKPDAAGRLLFIAGEDVEGSRSKVYPYGYINCGLAHGVPGILGVLSLAMNHGWKVPGIEEGAASLARWLVAQQIKDANGINWPATIEPERHHEGAPVKGSRAAWCYGVPGIARVLYLAGQALHDASLTQLSLRALDGLMARPRLEWDVCSPNLCHGLSGILQVSVRMYHDTGYARLLPFIETIVEEIVSLYNPSNRFGLQERRDRHDPYYDTPQLLQGTSGVALALLAVSKPISPDWDRLFLLA